MTALRVRLHRIELADVAGLLGGSLNAILRAGERDDPDEADRQAEWWESALAGPVDELAARIDRLRGGAEYRAAQLAFAADQQWRAASLRNLHQAIVERSERGYRRWRWSAHAYLGAVGRFVDDQALRAQAAMARREIEAGGAAAILRRSRVHGAHFSALREGFTAKAAGSGAEQQHTAERARDVLAEVARRERERAELQRRRDELRREARAAGIRQDLGADSASLTEQVRKYERGLRANRFAAAGADATAAARALEVRLDLAFSDQSTDLFAGYEGETPLLVRLAGTLVRPPRPALPGNPTPRFDNEHLTGNSGESGG